MTDVERGRVLEHIDPRPHFTNLDVDMAIEAATEQLDLKLELFRKLNESTPPEAILATNTSSISITTIGAVTDAARARDRDALHESRAGDEARRSDPRFRRRATRPRKRSREFAEELGKTPVEVARLPRLRRQPRSCCR